MYMCILGREDIKRELASGNLVVKPISEKQIQPGSIDLRMGNKFKFWKVGHLSESVDPRKEDMSQYFQEKEINDYVIIRSGEKVKGISKEWLELPANIQAYVDGKSSWGRIDLLVHQIAGVIDAGFKGHIVLWIENKSPLDMKINVGELICQIKFHYLRTKCEKVYDGRYQNQKDILDASLYKGEYVNNIGVSK